MNRQCKNTIKSLSTDSDFMIHSSGSLHITFELFPRRVLERPKKSISVLIFKNRELLATNGC